MDRTSAHTPAEHPGPGETVLEWEHIVTRTKSTETTGEIYQAVMEGGSRAT